MNWIRIYVIASTSPPDSFLASARLKNPMHRYTCLIVILLTALTLSSCRPTPSQPETNTQFLPLLEKSDQRATALAVPATDFPPTLPAASLTLTPSPISMAPLSGTSVILLPLVMRPKTALDLAWRLLPKTTHISQKDGIYVFQLTTPAIEGQTTDFVVEFERNIQEVVDAEKKDFLKTINVLPVENPGGFWTGNYQVASAVDWTPGIIPTDYSAKPATLKAVKAITDAGHPVLSILLQIEAYMGGSYPVDHHKVVNYDLETGQLLKLSGLFKPNVSFLNAISDFAILNLLDRTDLDPTKILKGAAPQVENFSLWNITQRGLLITFEENQVGDYSVGSQQILIPYSMISRLLDPQGPLGVYAN